MPINSDQFVLYSNKKLIKLICSDVARYGVRSLLAVLWSGGYFTNRERRKKWLVFFILYICACQIVHFPFQRHPDSGMQSSKAGYEVVVKDHDLVDIKNWCFCLKCFSLINWFQTLVEIKVMYVLAIIDFHPHVSTFKTVPSFSSYRVVFLLVRPKKWLLVSDHIVNPIKKVSEFPKGLALSNY